MAKQSSNSVLFFVHYAQIPCVMSFIFDVAADLGKCQIMHLHLKYMIVTTDKTLIFAQH